MHIAEERRRIHTKNSKRFAEHAHTCELSGHEIFHFFFSHADVHTEDDPRI